MSRSFGAYAQFDADCFEYILGFWSSAQADFYGTPTTPGRFHAQQSLPLANDNSGDQSANPLVTKQAIIVLREELEYFSITKPGELARTDIKTGIPNDELRELKRSCGKALAERKTIFAALQRNVSKENNMAEQHLIDMLCMRSVLLSYMVRRELMNSGFDREDVWGYRACEPSRNIISSMALVLLKTGIIHPGDPGAEPDATVPVIDNAQMSTAQKLLLFWRKPAVRRFKSSWRSKLMNSENAGGMVSNSMYPSRALPRT